MPCRQVHEASMLSEEHVAWQHSQSARARPGHVRESSVEIGGPSRLDELKLHAQPPCRDFCSRQHLLFRAFAEGTWQPEDSDLADPRNGLREQFQTLADELRGEVGQPRDIAVRPRKAGDEPAPNRIGSTSEDNGEGSGRLLGGEGGDCASSLGHDDINLERNQFGRESGEPLDLPFGISVFDHEVATLDVPEVTQPLEESLMYVRGSDRVGLQVAYSRDLGRLLRLGGKRCRPERKQCKYGATPVHLIPHWSVRP